MNSTFSSDQVMEFLSWLEDQREAGLTLDEVIEGLESGHFTANASGHVSIA